MKPTNEIADIAAELAWRDSEIERLGEELANYTAVEANDPKTWPTVLKQMKRIAELEAENERIRSENERLRASILGLFSWCEEVAGDTSDKEASAHEVETTQHAIDALR